MIHLPQCVKQHPPQLVLLKCFLIKGTCLDFIRLFSPLVKVNTAVFNALMA